MAQVRQWVSAQVCAQQALLPYCFDAILARRLNPLPTKRHTGHPQPAQRSVLPPPHDRHEAQKTTRSRSAKRELSTTAPIEPIRARKREWQRENRRDSRHDAPSCAQQRYPHSGNDLPSGFSPHQACLHEPSPEQSSPRKGYRWLERGLQVPVQRTERLPWKPQRRLQRRPRQLASSQSAA